MVALLLLMQVSAESVSSICSKEYAKREQNSPLLFPMISALFSLIYFLIIAKLDLYDTYSLLYFLHYLHYNLEFQ